MRIPKTMCSVLLVVSGAAAIAGQRVTAPPRMQSQRPRLIDALTPAERNQLPASTQVKLPTGKIVTLGTLRAQHESRMRAFAAAAGLGRAMAEKLNKQPAEGQVAGNINGAAVMKGTSRAGILRTQVAQPPARPNRVTQLANLNIVPFQPPSGIVPKDYLDFCNAAQPTVCLFLPAGCDFWHPGGHTICDDWMITDADICKYDGGSFYAGFGGLCRFEYPLFQRKLFLPTGPATVTASCNLGTYKFDPKGAVQASAPDSYWANFSTPPGAPQSCVVQVRLSRGY